MTNEQRVDIKVGLTVLLGIVVLLFGIAWAKGWHFGPKAQIVQAAFPTAGGLEVGDPVTINGLKRGTVKSVELRELDTLHDVLVTMEFQQKVDLRQDARADIGMLELMGGKRVELLAGSSPVKLPPSAIIRGNYAGDIGTLVAMVSSLSGTVQSITGKADTLLTSLNTFFAGGDLRGDINLTLTDARATLSNFNSTANHLNSLLAENGPALKRTLEQADVATRDLGDLLRENRPGLKGFLDSTNLAVSEARLTMARATGLLGRLDSLFVGGGSKNSLMSRLMKDDGFASRVDTALIELTRLSHQIRFQGLDANIRFFNSADPAKQ